MKTIFNSMRPLLLGVVLILGAAMPQGKAHAETALVAGGCFWCVEADFEKVKGVTDVVSGFAGGTVADPTYDQVTGGNTGHYEVARITYDESQISYDQIISLFLRSIDVTDAGGQFCDRGDSYRTAIFALNDEQARLAQQEVSEAEEELGQEVVTPVKGAAEFYPADEYHQDYYKKSDLVLTRRGPKTKEDAYDFYRESCGRDERVRQLWGDDAPFIG